MLVARPDLGRKQTDRKLLELENRIKKEYARAQKELAAKMNDYFRRFKIKDEIKLDQLSRGVISQQEYTEWRIGQMAVGRLWQDMVDTVANDLVNYKAIAKSVTNGYMPEVYCINFNYQTYDIEMQARIDSSFTLYNREAVERILRDDPSLLPPPGKQMLDKIARGEAARWERKQVQSVTMQAIVQGESVPRMATRIARNLSDNGRKASIRYARTAITEAENAGRFDAQKRMSGMGIGVRRTWVATLDARTRDAHRELDGQTVGMDEPFHNSLGDIMFPGDQSADPANFWNCRCGTITQVDGFETDVRDLSLRNTDKMGGLTYDEWKKEHGKSQSILNPDKVAAIMKARYVKEYKR